MVDSVDIEAFRKLKLSKSPFQQDPLVIKRDSSQSIKTPEIPQSLINKSHTADPIMEAWRSASIQDEPQNKVSRKSPLSFRIPDEYLTRLMSLKGRGVGSRIMSLLDFYSRSRKILKDQVLPLASILGQIDKELNSYSSNLNSMADLRGPDGSRIYKLSNEASVVHQIISFDKELHGEYLSIQQMKTLNFALGLSRNQSQ